MVRYDPKMPNGIGVYLIMCLVNGKTYVGSSCRMRKRFNEHVHYLRRGTHNSYHLQRAWNRYGTDAFVFCVIEWCDRSAQTEREQAYIDLYQSVDVEKGYNLAPRAMSNLGCKRTPEAIEKMRLAALGVVPSEESRRRKRETWNENRDEWISKAIERDGKDYDLISPTGQCVKGRGITKLAREVGIHHSDLCRLVDGKANTVKGWRSATHYVEPPSTRLLNPAGQLVVVPFGQLSVFCRDLGLTSGGMQRMLRGERTHYHGWRAALVV